MKRRRKTRSRSRVRKEVPPAGAMRMARKCCVRSCEADVQEARAKGLPLHHFPKDPILRTKWLTSGGFDEAFKPTPGQLVCHKHFKRADYEAAKGHKLLLRKGSVPSVFADYDNHPDPVIMSLKSSTSYAQEDLDLINSEILNLGHSMPSVPEEATPKSDSCGEQCYSRPASSTDSFLPLEQETPVNDSKSIEEPVPEENPVPVKQVEAVNNSNIKVNTMAVQLGIMEPEVAMENVTNNIIIKEELKDLKSSEDKKFDSSVDLKPKSTSKGGIKFFPGAKLEAKDFNDKWYSAKVVETDWAEREVLIHFDKLSSRFDEWIPMDSSRLRILQSPPSEQVRDQPPLETNMREFSVGERILATWADGRKYPAKVNAVLGNDNYDVLFDDGYGKVVKSSKMTRIAGAPLKQQPIQGDNYIGSKQERRDKKRKHTVMELFHTHSRKRVKNDIDKTGRKGDSHTAENLEYFSENRVNLDGNLFGPCYDAGTDLLRGFDTNIPKMKTNNKRNKKEIIRHETDYEDVGPQWINGEPQGIESFIVDGNDGPRRSIIVQDKRLPPGWQKHFTQRKAGTSAGKWDVLFIHKSSGKKFRSRNDIRAFMENQGQFDFDPERFDFCIHRKKKGHVNRIRHEPVVETPRKIKTLLPKTKAPTTTELTSPPVPAPSTPVLTPTTPPINDGAIFIGGLRVEMEDSAYKCPKEGCNKNFRKENLLQMHIKHYHPEYSKFLGSTPNVADLAYARTIGESVEDLIPKKSVNLLDKINKIGRKKFQDKSPSTTSQAINSLQPASPSLAVSSETEDLLGEKCSDLQKDSLKRDAMSPMSSHSFEINGDLHMKRENACAMSPGTLFDMKLREEKTQSGIKTLLPVRSSTEVQKDRSKSLDESIHVDRVKAQRKRHLSEYSTETAIRGKKRHGVHEALESYADLDDSTVDAEGPTGLVYRYSHRKSDSKSDENSQNSQLNDSRLEKDDLLKKDTLKRDNNDPEEGEGVMMLINGEMVKVEQLRREEIINCTCGFMEEDGLMIQCDLCLCWQHGHCNAIEREKDVPDKYVCYICRHPYRQRPSKKYYHDQDWIKEGKLPILSDRTKNQDSINKRTAMLKRSYDLVAALLQIQQILHSLRVKINVAQKKDHPKLYLWAKNWEKIEIPKPELDPIPVIEITRPPVESTEINTECTQYSEVKSESRLIVKEDYDEKSIASDSELMKILEEDSTHSDESKHVKKEDEVSESDTHILLDALTKNDSLEEKPNIESSIIRDDDTNNSTEASLMLGENLQEGTDVPSLINEISPVPLQPFIPEPEAPIDPTECRMRLLEHIEHFQSHIDSRLTSIEAQVSALEAMDPEVIIPNVDIQSRTKQTVQMLLRDLNTVRKLASLC
ncbi:PHD finger protein 20-like protein 1 isoform X2 [Prorops nasuta]|uniref:PHD finger protein 20-like protein 1 isoform X2 n=1 Tax=Prorops nasuta TaxID=863751 RepID=UPI0034CD6CA9